MTKAHGCGIIVVLLVVLGFCVQAQAQSEKTWNVAVLNVIGEGVEDDLALQITQVIKRETARNPAHKLVQQEDIALLESLLLFGCEEPTPECMTQLAESLSADRLIYGRLREIDGLYDIKITIFDRNSGQVFERWNKRFTANADVIGFFGREMETFLGGQTPVLPIILRVAANVEGALVVIDGENVGRTPFLSEKLKPGRHSIEVSKQGYVPWTYEGNFVEGNELNFKASLALEGGGAVSGGAVESKNGKDPDGGDTTVDTSLQLRTVGWIATGLGTASLITGTVFGVLVLQSESDAEATPYYAEAKDIEDRGKTQATLANVFFGTGAALIITGVILVMVDDSGESSGMASSENSGPRDISVTGAATSDGAGVMVEVPW